MSKKIDRTGEKKLNNFGSKIIIKEYRKRVDIDVYFPEYNWTFKHAEYKNFKNGEIKCPYEPRTYGVGYLGEGRYKISKNNIWYKIWHGMLMRCYDPKFHEKEPAYKGCTVENYWLNFQYMCKWLEENYYEMSKFNNSNKIDKDILCKKNKVYSRETCIFVPERINLLFTKRDNCRGKDPIGVDQLPSGNYQARCRNGYGEQIRLGTYSTKEEAFQVYKQCKENYIKQIADEYKGRIPDKLYNALYNYEVEIDD